MKTTSLPKLVDFVVAYCSINSCTITPLKLQKILYYIQSWHVAKFNKHTLFNELPEAWVNGPVYRSVYNMYKQNFYRTSPILLKIAENQAETILSIKKDELDVEKEQIEVIHTITKFYASFEEQQLVLMTHTDAPWNIARIGFDDFERCNKDITADSMYEFYNPKIK